MYHVWVECKEPCYEFCANEWLESAFNACVISEWDCEEKQWCHQGMNDQE